MPVSGRPIAEDELTRNLPEVYSAEELAMAAGVTAPLVRLLITGAEIGTVDGELIPHSEAVKAVHAFRTGRLRGHPSGARPGVFGSALANPPSADPRQRRKSVMVSTGLHATAALLVTMLATAQLTTAADDPDLFDTSRLDRLVFLATPGPGGGGGGGGLRQPMPPPKAEREGPATISSPVPERIEPRKIEPVPEPEPPKPKLLENESLPPVFAPLVPSRADSRDVRGLLAANAVKAAPEPEPTSQGPGVGGGGGRGGGAGIGPGSGSGVGPGTGGGTGGGPYRPGSGIAPPRLLREVKPRYTEEARRQSIEGDVLLEIVVLADGRIGSIRVVRSLGHGLDDRAVDAVRQWRFAAAERYGTPVDVLVEIAVEFRLR